MFGTLKPHRCSLGCARSQEHARFYCGLCKSLGDHYGTVTRATLSHDAVFLGLLADALLDEPAAPSSCRCPLLPLVHRPTVRPDSVAMRYAAAMQIALGEQWLADRAEEGKALARMVRPLATGWVERARGDLEALGVSIAPLDGFERRQSAAERLDVSPAEVAAPTMEALGYVFRCIPLLPGSTGAARAEEVAERLDRLGRAVGGVIYWTDALEDLEKDYLRGDFNPCIAGRSAGTAGFIDPAAVEQVISLLDAALRRIEAEVAALPLARHRALLENILTGQLQLAARRAAASARALAEADRRARLAALRAMPWLLRVGQRALVAAMLLWSWLLGLRVAFGQERPPALPSAARVDAGVDAGEDAGADAGAAAASAAPFTPVGPSASGRPGAPDAGADPRAPDGGAGEREPDATDGTPTCLRDGGGGAAACKDLCCCDRCQSCCSDCPIFKDCGKCCSVCDVCKDCQNCGNCCSGCGDCGKGCGDCGRGCGNCGSCCR